MKIRTTLQNSNYIFYFILVALLCNTFAYKLKSPSEKCQICSDLVENFIKGLKSTSKGNFGGGNTDWEDRKLGNYLKSETRFEEILESTCKETACHQLVEEYEDELLDWFKNKQENIQNEFYNGFCVNQIKFCCPKEKFGSKCEACPTNFGSICSGHGKCDGDGTRGGTGKCICDTGYGSELCNQCKTGHFEEMKNETYIKCTECYKSCANCERYGADACLSCKSGWIFNKENNLCEDVNECLQESNKCGKNEYCENSDGSFSCLKCDPACSGCTGTGPDKCLQCNKGYRKVEENCVDIDECQEGLSQCQAHQKCVNKHGTYDCIESESEKTENRLQEDNLTTGSVSNSRRGRSSSDFDDDNDEEKEMEISLNSKSSESNSLPNRSEDDNLKLKEDL